MHAYRTHTCGQLRASDAGASVRLSGWIHSKRDHGGLLFIDLRDHYGLTQCVLPAGSAAFATADALRQESVITVTGKAYFDIGHAPKDQSNRRKRLPDYAAWEVHPVMKIEVQ